MKSITFFAIVLLTLHPITFAADAPAAAPAPTTTPTTKPPQKIVIPPGFQQLNASGRNALIEAKDKDWVTTAFSKVPAPAKPATMPATFNGRISAQREPLIRQVMADLAVSDVVKTANLYDTQLTAQIRNLDKLQVPIYFLVATSDRMGELMKNGWAYPHFYYNRAADAVSYNPTGLLNIDGPMDDVIYPAPYEPMDTPDKREQMVVERLKDTDRLIQQAIEIQCQNIVPTSFANMVTTLSLEPLALKNDQTWFGVGVASVLSAKYSAPIYDLKRDQLVQSILLDNPANPLKMSAIDLLHPADLSGMRQEALPAYFDTLRRKSARAVQGLIEKGGGDQAITKAIVAIQSKKPADGVAMVKVIQEATGVDLTPYLVR